MEWVENRIASIFNVLKKHHLETEKDLLELRDEMETQLAGIDDADTQTHELEKEISSLEKDLNKTAVKISEKRKKQAQPKEKAEKKHHKLLILEKAAFEIKILLSTELKGFLIVYVTKLFIA